jgi:hypothetical protein
VYVPPVTLPDPVTDKPGLTATSPVICEAPKVTIVAATTPKVLSERREGFAAEDVVVELVDVLLVPVVVVSAGVVVVSVIACVVVANTPCAKSRTTTKPIIMPDFK